MSRIHGTDTGPELILARFLKRHGVYFARYAKDLPGKPDIVFRRCRLAVFVDGEFWHGHEYLKWKDGLSPFWRTKIEQNMARDRAVDKRLKSMDWLPVHVWGRQILRNAEKSGRRILSIREKRLDRLSGR
jgi:DNA mismatch endonuclease (patch repair protein)